MAVPDLPRADRLRNDELIAAAAARLLATDPRASMQAIADEAGVARYTVYRRFPTREALEDGIREATIRQVMTVVAGFAGWDDGVEGFRTLVAGLLDAGRRFPTALSRHRAGPGDGPVDRRMIEILGEGQRLGLVRTDVTPTFLNSVVLAILGAASHSDVAPDQVASETAVDMVLGAIG